MKITSGCVDCTNRWVSRGKMPPCHRTHYQAEKSGAVVIHFMRPNQVGSDCPRTCSLRSLQWLAKNYGKRKIAVNGHEIDISTAQLQLKSLVEAMHTYRNTPLESESNEATVSNLTRYGRNGRRWQWYARGGWVLVMSYKRDGGWSNFEDSYVKYVAPRSIGVPSSWSLTTTSGGEGALPIKVVVSGGAAKGDILIKEDGAKKAVKLSYTAGFVSVGVGFVKKIKIGAGAGAESFPSMGYRILLGSRAGGALTKNDFLGSFYMVVYSASAGASGAQSVIWFGVPGRVPQFEDADLLILGVKCKAVGRVMGTAVSLPGVSLGGYYGEITSATEVDA